MSVAQRKPQSLPDDFSRHCDLAARCSDEAHHRVAYIAVGDIKEIDPGFERALGERSAPSLQA